jgi:hypothetical protein
MILVYAMHPTEYMRCIYHRIDPGHTEPAIGIWYSADGCRSFPNERYQLRCAQHGDEARGRMAVGSRGESMEYLGVVEGTDEESELERAIRRREAIHEAN